MLLSGAPTKTTVPFANSGAKNTIPVAASGTAGLASYTTGFPALTMTPLSAGGIPPAGQDFNGILNAISQAVQYYSAGATFAYDSTFSSAVSGYPKGAVLQNATRTSLWISATDANTTNPDSGGAGWVEISAHGIATFTSSGTFTPLFSGIYFLSGCAGGGSGGGGGSNNASNTAGTCGSGGGAGTPVIRKAFTLTGGVIYTVTIGSGGAAVAGAGQGASPAPNGNPGGSTIFSGSGITTLTLTAGSGGIGGSQGATGNVPGPVGGPGFPAGGASPDGGSVSNAYFAVGGIGAGGPFGAGGAGGRSGAGGGVAATVGFGFGTGGGGGGSAYLTGGGGASSSAGMPGLLMIEW